MRKIAFAAATAVVIASSPAHAEGWTGAYVNAGVSGSASSADVTTEFSGELTWTVNQLLPTPDTTTGSILHGTTAPVTTGFSQVVSTSTYTANAVQQVFAGLLSGNGKANNRFRAGAIVEAGYDYEVGGNFVIGLNGSYNFTGTSLSDEMLDFGETDAWTHTQQFGKVKVENIGTVTGLTPLETALTGKLSYLGDSNIIKYTGLTFTGNGTPVTLPTTVESGIAASQTQFSIGDNWSIGARAGVAASPSLLVFATGGYTKAEVGLSTQAAFLGQNRAALPDTIDNVGQTSVISGSKWKDGYYLGGGVEAKLTSNISIKAEYRFADYGSYGLTGSEDVVVGKLDKVDGTGPSTAPTTAVLSEKDLFDLTVPVNYSVTADNIRTHALRVTLGYRF